VTCTLFVFLYKIVEVKFRQSVLWWCS